jgi:hypothetical protein
MNQDVFGNPTDTSGALGILTYADSYTSYVTNKEPLLRSVPTYTVSSTTYSHRNLYCILVSLILSHMSGLPSIPLQYILAPTGQGDKVHPNNDPPIGQSY